MKTYEFTERNGKSCGKLIFNEASGENNASLSFYGDICGNTWESSWYDDDKAPQDVADFLNSLENKSEPLDIYINSGGGDVFGGIAIYNILKRYQGEKTAHIDGIAASIAGIIPFACDKIIAPKAAQIMLHKPWTICTGNADDLRRSIECLEKCEDSIIAIYAENTVNDTTAEDIRAMMDKETWLTCEEAAKYFRIEIDDSEPAAACASEFYARYRHMPKFCEKEPGRITDDTQEKQNRKRRLQLEHDCLSMRFFL